MMDNLKTKTVLAEKEELIEMLARAMQRERKEAGFDLTGAQTVKMPAVWAWRFGYGALVLVWIAGWAWFTATYIRRDTAESTFAKREDVALISSALNTMAKAQQELVTQVAVINSNTSRMGALESRMNQLERDQRTK